MTLLPPPSDAELLERLARKRGPNAVPAKLLKPPVPTEKEVQAAVRRLLSTVAASVYDTSQPFRAAITPGVPDLIAFVPGRGLVFIECKRPGGKQSPAQREFQAECEAAGVPYILGGCDEVAAYLNRSQSNAA